MKGLIVVFTALNNNSKYFYCFLLHENQEILIQYWLQLKPQ